MRKTPGKWVPPEKPEDVGLGDNSLSRIMGSLSPMAFETAAQKARAMNLKYGDSEVFESVQPPSNFHNYGSSEIPDANFDAILDDDLYRTAQALYAEGCPEDSIELEDGTVVEAYPNELALLIVREGRSANHVDIRVAESMRELEDLWARLTR